MFHTRCFRLPRPSTSHTHCSRTPDELNCLLEKLKTIWISRFHYFHLPDKSSCLPDKLMKCRIYSAIDPKIAAMQEESCPTSNMNCHRCLCPNSSPSPHQ